MLCLLSLQNLEERSVCVKSGSGAGIVKMCVRNPSKYMKWSRMLHTPAISDLTPLQIFSYHSTDSFILLFIRKKIVFYQFQHLYGAGKL